tara:strand:- start:347 stop:1021 length:675 start_codon:yes stop_codon:yes gene_type:complete
MNKKQKTIFKIILIFIVFGVFIWFIYKDTYENFTTDEFTYIHKELFEILDKLLPIFNNHGINYWANSGTLLGCVRESKIIDKDDDIDLALFKDDFLYLQNNKNNIVGDLNNNGLHFIKLGEEFSLNKIVKLKKDGDYTKNKIFIDLMAFDKINGIYKHINDSWPEDNFKEEELLPLKKGMFNHIEINIPNNPIENLKRNYSDNWKTPDNKDPHHKLEINLNIKK